MLDLCPTDLPDWGVLLCVDVPDLLSGRVLGVVGFLVGRLVEALAAGCFCFLPLAVGAVPTNTALSSSALLPCSCMLSASRADLYKIRKQSYLRDVSWVPPNLPTKRALFFAMFICLVLTLIQ